MPRTNESRASWSEALRQSTRSLLERYRLGRASALDVILKREIPELTRWARGRLPRWARSFADTGDLVQDTLARTIPQLSRFEPQHKKALQAYLRSAVRNRITDELRRAGRTPIAAPIDDVASAGEIAATGRSPLELLLDEERTALFSAALASLKDTDRQAVVARLRLGYSYEQVALVLGKRSPDAARVAVTRAVQRLLQQIAGQASTQHG